MSWLSGLSLSSLGPIGQAISLYGAIQNMRRGSGLSRDAQSRLDEAVTSSGNAYYDALKAFKDSEASGAFDAGAAMKQAGEQASHDLTLRDKNTASQLATLGYRRGDSVFGQSAAHNSESANLALQQRLLDTQNFYDGKKQTARSSLLPYLNAYNQALERAGSMGLARGDQIQADGYSTISNLIANMKAPVAPQKDSVSGKASSDSSSGITTLPPSKGGSSEWKRIWQAIYGTTNHG